MKLPTRTALTVAAAVLALSATAPAQSAETFHFGEGQSSMQGGAAHAPQKTAPHRKTPHRKPAHRGTTQPDTYSHS